MEGDGSSPQMNDLRKAIRRPNWRSVLPAMRDEL